MNKQTVEELVKELRTACPYRAGMCTGCEHCRAARAIEAMDKRLRDNQDTFTQIATAGSLEYAKQLAKEVISFTKQEDGR